jgi:hypothetical protein
MTGTEDMVALKKKLATYSKPERLEYVEPEKIIEPPDDKENPPMQVAAAEETGVEPEKKITKRATKTLVVNSMAPADWTAWALGLPLDCVRTKLVLVGLVQHCDAKNTAYVGAEKLAEELHAGRAMVRSGFDTLEKLGIIEQIGTVGRAKRWQVNGSG